MDVPPAPHSPKNILNVLNDDCIGEILRRLTSFKDFLNAAETCKRFQKCAMHTQHRFKSISFGKLQELDQLVNIPACRAVLILKNYGHMFKSIEWSPNGENSNQDDEIYESIVRFCAKTLKRLLLSDYSLKFSEHNPFQALERLEYITDLNADPQIKLSCDRPWFVRRFPNLQNVLFLYNTQLTDNMITEFLSLNPKLQVFRSELCTLTPDIFKSIGTYCKNLQILYYRSAFKIYEFNDNLLHLKELKMLRKLWIFGEYSFEKLMNMLVENDIPISALGIYVAPTETAENIPTLKTLKHITLYTNNRVLSDDFLINLVKSQTTLESIQVYGNDTVTLEGIIKTLEWGKNLTEFKFISMVRQEIDLETYSRILNLANDRVKVRLLITDLEMSEVPINVQNANRKWLNIHGDLWSLKYEEPQDYFI